MAGKVSRSFRLVGVSWRLVGSDPKLLLLPLGAVITSAAAVWLLATAGLLRAWTLHGNQLLRYASMYAVFAVISFITICFNATLVAVALKRLEGEPASIADGWAVVRPRLGAVVRWALLSASIGVILQAIRERTGVLGGIFAFLGQMAWGLATFFVVPVLLVEPVDVRSSIRRSASIFRQRWTEQVVANVTIGAIFGIALIPALVLSGLLMLVSVPLGVSAMILSFVTMIALSSAVAGVFTAALYRFAVAGTVPAGFTAADFEGAFKPRRKGRGGSGFIPTRPDL